MTSIRARDDRTRLLIFDLDGTLIDSAPDIVSAVNGLMRARGRPELPEAQVKAAIGEGLRTLIEGLFPETQTSAAFLREFEAEFRLHYERHLLERTQVFPGVFDFLERWSGSDGGSEGRAIAIVTNKDERFARICVEGLGLARFPWLRLFGADSLPAKKPDPLPLIEAMRAAGVTPTETVMVGDGLPDMGAALRAGTYSAAAEYGYCELRLLVAAGATTTFADFARLPDALARIEALRPAATRPPAA